MNLNGSPRTDQKGGYFPVPCKGLGGRKEHHYVAGSQNSQSTDGGGDDDVYYVPCLIYQRFI